MSAEFHRKIIEIQNSVRERELHRLELERELTLSARRKERNYERLRSRLHSLKQELLQEEQTTNRRIDGLIARVGLLEKEYDTTIKKTIQLRMKQKQYDLKCSLNKILHSPLNDQQSPLPETDLIGQLRSQTKKVSKETQTDLGASFFHSNQYGGESSHGKQGTPNTIYEKLRNHLSTGSLAKPLRRSSDTNLSNQKYILQNYAPYNSNFVDELNSGMLDDSFYSGIYERHSLLQRSRSTETEEAATANHTSNNYEINARFEETFKIKPDEIDERLSNNTIAPPTTMSNKNATPEDDIYSSFVSQSLSRFEKPSPEESTLNMASSFQYETSTNKSLFNQMEQFNQLGSHGAIAEEQTMTNRAINMSPIMRDNEEYKNQVTQYISSKDLQYNENKSPTSTPEDFNPDKEDILGPKYNSKPQPLKFVSFAIPNNQKNGTKSFQKNEEPNMNSNENVISKKEIAEPSQTKATTLKVSLPPENLEVHTTSESIKETNFVENDNSKSDTNQNLSETLNKPPDTTQKTIDFFTRSEQSTKKTGDQSSIVTNIKLKATKEPVITQISTNKEDSTKKQKIEELKKPQEINIPTIIEERKKLQETNIPTQTEDPKKPQEINIPTKTEDPKKPQEINNPTKTEDPKKPQEINTSTVVKTNLQTSLSNSELLHSNKAGKSIIGPESVAEKSKVPQEINTSAIVTNNQQNSTNILKTDSNFSETNSNEKERKENLIEKQQCDWSKPKMENKLLDDERDFFDDEIPLTDTTAYQRMLGILPGVSQQSQGSTKKASPKPVPRIASRWGVSSEGGTRPSDTDSIDSVEAAIQESILGKNAPPTEKESVHSSPEARPSTPETSREASVKSNLGTSKPATKIPVQINLDSDTESYSVSAGVGTDDDDFDF